MVCYQASVFSSSQPVLMRHCHRQHTACLILTSELSALMSKHGYAVAGMVTQQRCPPETEGGAFSAAQGDTEQSSRGKHVRVLSQSAYTGDSQNRPFPIYLHIPLSPQSLTYDSSVLTGFHLLNHLQPRLDRRTSSLLMASSQTATKREFETYMDAASPP